MRQLALLVFAVLATAAISAEAQCPANVKAIPFHNVNRHQIVVGVSINHSAPYDFLLDTGTQMTVVDRSVAADLHLAATGPANVAGVSFRGEANFAQLEMLAVGDRALVHQGVLVYDMSNVQAAGFAIRGLLGEDFLSQFNVLIDNAHHVLCLDDAPVLQASAANSGQ
jgi:hypothetical protein